MSAHAFRSIETDVLIDHLLSSNTTIALKAWEDLYVAYYPSIKNFIIANNGLEYEATDIFQDTLVIFLQNIKNKTFRKDASLQTYLFSIARNLWMNELARQKKMVNIDPDDLMLVVTPVDINYLMTVDILGILMNELSEECRQTLIEFYYNNKSMSELKDIFSVSSVEAAKNKKWRCLGYLIKLFKERSPIRI